MVELFDDQRWAVTPTDSNNIYNLNSGNVGIGTSTPLAKLDIQGTQGQLFSVTDDLSGSIFAVSDISGVPIFDVNSSGVSYFDGDVGIGTTSPSAKLEVNGQTVINSTGLTEGFQWFNDANEIFSLEDTSGAGELLLLSSNSVKVKLNANGNSYLNGGNVGIGTTSPDTLLNLASGEKGTNAPTVRITNTFTTGDWSGDTNDLGRFEFFTEDVSGNAPYTLGYISIKNDYTTGTPTLPSGAMVFATTTYNAPGGAAERMRIIF